MCSLTYIRLEKLYLKVSSIVTYYPNEKVTAKKDLESEAENAPLFVDQIHSSFPENDFIKDDFFLNSFEQDVRGLSFVPWRVVELKQY